MRKAIDIVLTAVCAFALLAMGGTLITGRPFLAAVVKSNSMVPGYARGDIAFIWNWPRHVSVGDVILFKPTDGSLAGQWTLHRIVSKDESGAFVTMGDAATLTDQEDGLANPVLPSDIGGIALSLGSLPIKVPWLGRLALLATPQRMSLQRKLLAPMLLALTAVAVFELVSGRSPRPRKKRQSMEQRTALVLLGAILSVVLVTLTFYQSLRITLVYEVGESPGILFGQPLGVITHGQVVRRELARLENRGFFPMLILVSDNDPNISVDCRLEWLQPKATRIISAEVRGTVDGDYSSPVDASLLFPLLPPAVILWLARLGHRWVAVATCLPPGVAVALIGILNPEGRRRLARDWRRATRRLASILQ